jgi:hypothetical protein
VKQKIITLAICVLMQYASIAQNQLDSLGLGPTPTAQVAYSLRMLSSSYTGFPISIRRSSDNAEANVFFDINGEVSALSNVKLIPGINLTAALGTVRTGTISAFQNRAGTITVNANLTGTISITGRAVTGTGTLFTTQLVVGDFIYNTNGEYLGQVEIITNNTNLTLFVHSPIVGVIGNFRRKDLVVTGVGTTFTTQLAVGDKLYNQTGGAFIGEVTSITSNTVLNISHLGATTVAGVTYRRNTATVTGTGTSFTTELSVGQMLTANNITIGVISSIATNTSLTLETKSGFAINGIAYRSTPATTTISTFMGASSLFVSKWYDQSGNARDMSQVILASQPRLADAGTIETVNTRTVVRFGNSAGQFLNTVAPASWINGTAYSILSVSKPFDPTVSNAWTISTLNSNGGQASRVLVFGFRDNTTISLAHFSDDINFTTTLGSALEVVSAVKLAVSGSQLFRDGILIASGGLPANFLNNVGPLAFGRYRELYLNGFISEVVIFSAALSTIDRETVEDNQINFFNIPKSKWTGTLNTDWNNSGNWLGGIPTSTTPNVVTIPNVPNKPVINTSVSVRNLEIQTGSSLTIATGGTLNLHSSTFTAPVGSITATNGTFAVNNVLLAFNLNPAFFVSNTMSGLIINNPTGVNLTGDLTLSNNLTLQTGRLAIGANTLTLNGTITNLVAQGITGSTTSNINIGGTVVRTLSMNQTSAATRTINNLNINCGGCVTTIDNALVTNGILTFNGNSKLSINGQSLTLGGGVTNTTAQGLRGSVTSNLIVNNNVARTLSFDQTTPGTTNALNNLTINSTGVTNITLDNSLMLRGNLTPTSGILATANNLTLVSDATSTANVLTGSSGYISGNVTVQRFIPSVSRRWRFVSSAVSGRTIEDWRGEVYITGPGVGNTVGTTNSNGFDATQTNTPSLYFYNESTTGLRNNGWTAPTNTTATLGTGRGYRLFVRGDRSNLGRLDGTVITQNAVTIDVVGPIHTGNVIMPVTFTNSAGAAEDGWNLLGNPYPSAYSWNALHDAGRVGVAPNFSGTNYNNLSAEVHVFDAQTNNYISFNAASDLGDLTGGIIPSQAAFWVKSAAGTTALTLIETHKTATVPVSIFKAQSANAMLIKLKRDEINADAVLLKYMNEALIGYDGMDILKLKGDGLSLAVETKEGDLLKASIIPPSENIDTFKLEIIVPNEGSYQFVFEEIEALQTTKPVYLYDSFKNSYTQIFSNDTYSFDCYNNSPESLDKYRFLILIGELNISTAIHFDENESDYKLNIYPTQTNGIIRIYSNSKNLNDRYAIQITDITGKYLHIDEMKQTYSYEEPINIGSLENGIYFIAILHKNRREIYRVIKY